MRRVKNSLKFLSLNILQRKRVLYSDDKETIVGVEQKLLGRDIQLLRREILPPRNPLFQLPRLLFE